jgi:ppGpp synthetase/RelA/SpoT-type nucleotidyltranferase
LAGKRLGDYRQVLANVFPVEYPIVEDWRVCHSFPLNSIFDCLNAEVSKINLDALVVHRLKRFISIVSKLIWEPTRLIQMQDIGGCRVVLDDLAQVKELARNILNTMPHELIDGDNYIERPTHLGYRGIHLVYRFNPVSEDAEAYRGMKIEIQIRTRLQHAWATAVEVAETCTGYVLKNSRGDINAEYLRFFQLVASAMAQKEGTPLVPDVSADVDELRGLEDRLRVRSNLTAYGAATHEGLSLPPGAEYYLLDLTPGVKEAQITITGFTRTQLEQANAEYAAADRAIRDGDARQVVLVSASSLAALRSAYPNYFLDSTAFTSAVDEILAA